MRQAAGLPAHSRIRAREHGGPGCGQQQFKRLCVRERFSNFSLCSTLDTHDPAAHHVRLSFVRRRSKIVEIVEAGDVIFALTLSGVCAAFRGNQRLCFMNVAPDEVIRSLFYNKAAQALVTVSVYREDNFSCLKCRSTPLADVRRGCPNAGLPIFTSETLRWPGFVEFDDVNGKVLTYDASCAPSAQYKVWSMDKYEREYTLDGAGVTEVKISPGALLLIHARQGSYVPLKLLAAADGRLRQSFSHLVHRTKKVELLELFHEKLLVKQEGEDLEIVDLHSGATRRVARTLFTPPAAFVFLYDRRHFLTFHGRTLTLWSVEGVPVHSFEDHELWHSDHSPAHVFVTAGHDYVLSCCRARKSHRSSAPHTATLTATHTATPAHDAQGTRVVPAAEASATPAEASATPAEEASAPGEEEDGNESASTSATVSFPLPPSARASAEEGPRGKRGAIHVSHIASGKCVARLGASTPVDMGEMTAIHFSEERQELYVGNREGFLYVWAQ